MSTVTAKFRCTEKATRASNYGSPSTPNTGHVELQPVAGPENKPWSQYTPCGKIEMQIDNPAALDVFEVGKDYFITFEPAPAETK